MESEESQIIGRKTAASGLVGYSDPVVLHETSRTRVELIPYYIPHSTDSRLAIKLKTLQKHPNASWVLSNEKSISLDNAATIRLYGCQQGRMG